jgi:hypothetical protein
MGALRVILIILGFLAILVGLAYFLGYLTHHFRMMVRAGQIGILFYFAVLTPIVILLCGLPIWAFLGGYKISRLISSKK